MKSWIRKQWNAHSLNSIHSGFADKKKNLVGLVWPVTNVSKLRIDIPVDIPALNLPLFS